MRIGQTLFRAVLVAGWVTILLLTLHAVATLGLGQLSSTFFGDFAHPWRAQFNGDFLVHLILVSGWMVYRAPSWPSGLVCAVLAITLGALFTFAYLLLATIRARGDMRIVLLGEHNMPRQ